MQDSKPTEYLHGNISLNNIGERLAGAHEIATSVKARCEVMKIEAAGHAAETVAALNKALEEFNKSMDETIRELNKLIG